MVSRRGFLKVSAASAMGLYLATRARYLMRAYGAVTTQIPLAGSAIPKFVSPLPTLFGDLDVILAGTDQIELQMTEFKANILPANAVPGYSGTWVWGYLKPSQTGRPTYLGPVIVATRGQPTEMKFVNNLGSAATTRVDAYKYGTDQTLHWADPLNN